MASKYTHRLLFYESWLADLDEPSKEFSPEEKWLVVQAIFQCQIKAEITPVEALPLSIRRALSIPTLTEQLRTILDKQAGASDRAQQAVAAKKAAAERRAQEQAKTEEQRANEKRIQDQQERQRKMKEFDDRCKDALGSNLHAALRSRFSGRDFLSAIWSLAVSGNEKCRAFMPNWDSLTQYDMLDITQYQTIKD